MCEKKEGVTGRCNGAVMVLVTVWLRKGEEGRSEREKKRRRTEAKAVTVAAALRNGDGF